MLKKALYLLLLVFLHLKAYAEEDYYLVMDKALYKVYLKKGEQTLFEFPAGYGLKSTLYKQKKGDFLTPEGVYEIKKIRPSSNYYYFVELSYPNENDLSWAYFSLGERVNSTQLGSEIGLHGGGPFKLEKGKPNYHWTQGCIALKNEDLLTLLKYLKPLQKVYLINSSKPLYEILKKLAFPTRVKPWEIWEGELYLKLNQETYWYFFLQEKEKGGRLLLFKEWIRGRLTRTLTSLQDGSLNHEEEFKEALLKNLHGLVVPSYLGRGYLWK